MALSENGARMVDLLKARLEPDGWAISVREPSEGANATTIKLSHPLSNPHGLAFFDDGSDQTAFVESALTDPEFEAIRARPTECPHASLLQRLRRSALANRWDPDVVAVVARVLRAENVLTADEAAWLEAAGPAWTKGVQL